MSGRLDGKVALVTGGSRGIGGATALLFGQEGAVVVVNYAVRRDDAEHVAQNIRRTGGEAIALQADVTSTPAVSAMVDQALERFGKIDLLVNNAGVWRPGTTLRVRDETLDELIAVNLKGAIHCVQAVVPGMIQRGYGKVVNVASVAALVTNVPENTPYAASKAALIALTKRMALELGPHGINVNAVCPGFILTEMARSSADESQLAAFAEKAVLGRLGEPLDIAQSVLFLASDEAGFVTGQVLTVDGGRTDFLSYSA